MDDPVQGMLPMTVETASRRGRAPEVRPALKGVQIGDPRGDLFDDGSKVARRDGSITGQVTRIRHANLETGFHILEVHLDDGGIKVTFVGVSEPVNVGDRVEATGTWERHAKYGRQLKARFIRALAPSTGREIHAFLVRGGVRGVGKKSADKLLAAFGDKLADAMTSPTSLMASGITEKQATAIADAWTMRTTHTEVMAYLMSLKIGPATCNQIIKRYGERAKQVITANPYVVAKDISGVGFKRADLMALSLGFDINDPRRIDAAVLHAMTMIARDGHCAAARMQIMQKVQDLLGPTRQHAIAEGIKRLIDRRLLVEEENGGSQVIYDANVLRCEEEISSRMVSRIGQIALPANIDDLISSTATECGIPGLHEHQALAVRTSLGARLSVITGGPGSGKTSSLKVLLGVFELLNPGCRIGLAAPTGRAAQRMAESTGREARTIHRMLEWAPDRGGFQCNEENPLDFDLVVIDEASMLDIWLARDVLRAVAPDATLVLVGDVDQLPSVGAGRVLGDVIDSGVVPVTKLTRIFRQGDGSLIATAAQEINAGRMPNIGHPNRKTDMWALWNDDPEESLARVVKLVAEVAPTLHRAPGEFFEPRLDVQVLTAGHNGTLGTINLNRVLQEAVNPETDENPGIRIGDLTFRIGDRVIQMANDYDLNVFNGDIGNVVAIMPGLRKDSFEITVGFADGEVTFTGAEAKNLNLAYAISVHKSQGSEFPFVIFTPSTQHSQMMRKTLLYTAVTRAKVKCAVVGHKKAAYRAVRSTDRNRVTGLHKRLTIEDAELARMTGT